MNFEDYSEFAELAEENGYDYDNELNREESSHKRSVLVTFYMKKKTVLIAMPKSAFFKTTTGALPM